MESRNDPLPISMAGIRGKGPKRYLERFTRTHYSLRTLYTRLMASLGRRGGAVSFPTISFRAEHHNRMQENFVSNELIRVWIGGFPSSDWNLQAAYNYIRMVTMSQYQTFQRSMYARENQKRAQRGRVVTAPDLKSGGPSSSPALTTS